MPLSEHEQRLLEQMERALYAEDPSFASNLKSGAGRFGGRGRLATAVIGVLAGAGVVLAGVATKVAALGVAGFVLMLVSVWLVLRAGATGLAQAAAGLTPSAPKPSSGFMTRAQERFDERRREQGL